VESYKRFSHLSRLPGRSPVTRSDGEVLSTLRPDQLNECQALKSTVEVGDLRRSLDTCRHFRTYRASRWVNGQRSESFLISKTAHRRSSPNTSSIAIVRLPLIWIIPAWIIRCAAPASGRCWLPYARGSPQQPAPPIQEAQSHLPTITDSTA
jgi:hypothetical protein